MRGLIIVLLAALTAPAMGQGVSKAQIEAAKKKLAEKQRQASTRPAPPPKVKGKPAPAPPPLPHIWVAKPGSPPEILAWLRRFPSLRQKDVETIGQAISDAHRALASMELQLQKIKRRPVEQISFQGTFGQWHSKPSKADSARRRAEVKAQEQKIAQQKDVIAELEMKKSKLMRDTLYLPLPNFKHAKGSFGRLVGGVRIVQIIDAANCIVSYEGTTFWLEGCDTRSLADDQIVPVETPVVVSGNRSFTTVLGAQRTVYVLKPFDWASHVDAVQVSQAEADAFWSAAPVASSGGLKPISPAPRPDGDVVAGKP